MKSSTKVRWVQGAAVRKHKPERHARGFTCWGQFAALAGDLPRIIGLGRQAQSIWEYRQLPSRSLAYANPHRPWQLYQTMFLELLDRCQEVADNGRRKFRFKNKLLSLDATGIDLCATL